LGPPLNAGEIELLDVPKLQEQLLTLVVRGSRIDHQPGDHDDYSNSYLREICGEGITAKDFFGRGIAAHDLPEVLRASGDREHLC
jgi:hypothetical protein